MKKILALLLTLTIVLSISFYFFTIYIERSSDNVGTNSNKENVNRCWKSFEQQIEGVWSSTGDETPYILNVVFDKNRNFKLLYTDNNEEIESYSAFGTWRYVLEANAIEFVFKSGDFSILDSSADLYTNILEIDNDENKMLVRVNYSLQNDSLEELECVSKNFYIDLFNIFLYKNV